MNGALAIVLARAGSKGLPGKNTAPVAGKLCIVWTIEQALKSESVSRVVVSSDAPGVRAIAHGLGAEAHEREASLASDTATVDAAARSAVAWGDATGNADPSARDIIVILYANVPVRPSDLIDRAVALLVESGCDSVQSYAPVGKHHPWWTARLDDDGAVRPWAGEVLNHGVHRRQDLPPAFVPDGGVIAVTREALFGRIEGVEPAPHAFFGRDRRGIETREGEVIDIDSEIDLLVADAVLKNRFTTESTEWHREKIESERSGA